MMSGRIPSGSAEASPSDVSPTETKGSQLEMAYTARKPLYGLRDVVLPSQTSSEINTLLSRIRNHDLIYREWGFSDVDKGGAGKTVSFFGKPGTGKTMCAEALAYELGLSIIEVSYSEIESKYVGETGKNISKVFASAPPDAVMIFFDEADSILGKRVSNVTTSADQAVNVTRAVMLKELDNFKGVVVFATNLAANIDSAFARRILMHIQVMPPNLEGRRLIWEKMLGPRVPRCQSIDFSEIAAISEGLTGGEIKNAALIALSECANRTASERSLRREDILVGIRNVSEGKVAVSGI